MNIQQAIDRVFAMMAARYGKRWEFQPSAAALWAEWLEGEGASVEGVLQAAERWSSENKWPPVYAEFHQAIPGNCRCGKNTCGECSWRAYQARCAALERGSGGYDGDSPVLPESGPMRIGEAAKKALPPRRR